jgi:hypothetical protein
VTVIGGRRYVVGILRSKRNRLAEGETVEQTLARLQAAATAHESARRAGVASQPAAAVESTTTPADWYPDPTNGGTLRYWDGTAWTDHFAFDEDEPPPVNDSQRQLARWERAINLVLNLVKDS